jgi:hypothetical protein
MDSLHLGAFRAIRRTFRNWPTVILARTGLRRYPVTGRLRAGGEVELGWNGQVMLWAFGCRPLPDGTAWIPYGERGVRLEGGFSFSAYETFFHHDYDMLPVEGRTVVDLGASIGDTPLYFSLRGARRVIAYEMDPVRYATFAANVERNRPNVVIPCLGAVTELASVVRQYHIDDGVLKMDIEGDEERVLDSTPAEDLRRFSHIAMEYHRGPERCRAVLRGLGYDVRTTRPHHVNGTYQGFLYAVRK